MKVCVVITTCDRPVQCSRAITSVLTQTRKPDRIIVIDDGASERFLVEHPDVELYQTTGYQGGAFARNWGASKADDCDILMFLDDDDVWLPEKIARQVEAFREHQDAVLVYTGRIIVSESGLHLYKVRANRSGFLERVLLVENFVGVTSGVAIQRDAFWEAGGFDVQQPARQDYDLWIRVSKLGRIVADGEYGVRYTLPNAGSNNVSRGKIDRHREAIRRLESKYDERLRQLPWMQRRLARANRSFYVAKILRTRSWLAGSKSAIGAFICFPHPKFILVALPGNVVAWLRRRMA